MGSRGPPSTDMQGPQPTSPSSPSDEIEPQSPQDNTREDVLDSGVISTAKTHLGVRDPRDLDEHPLLQRLFPDRLGDEDAQVEMAGSVAHLQRSPILITGSNCGTTLPNTILDGRRVRAAALETGLATVEVRVYDDLDDDAQAELIVKANLAAGLARRYTEREKAALEHHLLQRIGKKQGQRTSVAGDGGEWADKVANDAERLGLHDVTPRAVRDRHLIFYSPVSSALLKDAVASGKMTRKDGVAAVREALARPGVRDALTQAKDDGLTAEVIAELPEVREARSEVFRRSHKEHKQKAAKQTTATGVLIDGQVTIENFLGRVVEIAVVGDEVTLTDVGAVNPAASYDRQDAPTKTSWRQDVLAEVDQLPAAERSKIKVIEERLDPVHCPTCNGTRWWSRGGCATCTPKPEGSGHAWVWDLRHPRERISFVVIETGKTVSVTYWPSILGFSDKAHGYRNGPTLVVDTGDDAHVSPLLRMTRLGNERGEENFAHSRETLGKRIYFALVKALKKKAA